MDTWTLLNGRAVSEWTRETLSLAPAETFESLLGRLEKVYDTALISVVRADDDTLLHISFAPTDLDQDAKQRLLSDLPTPHPPFVDVIVVADQEVEVPLPPVRLWLN